MCRQTAGFDPVVDGLLGSIEEDGDLPDGQAHPRPPEGVAGRVSVSRVTLPPWPLRTEGVNPVPLPAWP